MKRTRYFLRTHKYELLAALVALIFNFITFINQDPKKLLIISLSINFVVLIFIIYWRTREKAFYFVPLTRASDKNDWIGKGEFDYDRDNICFSITNADPGYIYSKCLTWSDYTLSFDFRLISCLGVVVRAGNLSNYVLLHIRDAAITPHIRINGGWIEYPELSFENALSADAWYSCKIGCEKQSLNIRIFDRRQRIFDRQWEIPQGNFPFEFKADAEDSTPLTIPFPINLDYGSVGFRNWGPEKALIKNVLIEKH